MPTAFIIIRQNDSNVDPGSRDDLALNIPVVLLNANDTGIFSWLWQFIDRPNNSNATLSTPTQAISGFTPDVEGTYLIRLTINGGILHSQVGAAIKTENLQMRIPAASEQGEFNQVRGWAAAVNSALKVIDDGYGDVISQLSGQNTLREIYSSGTNVNDSTLFLNSTAGGLHIRDNIAPISDHLFHISNHNETIDYVWITSSEIFMAPGDSGPASNGGYLHLQPTSAAMFAPAGLNGFYTTDSETWVYAPSGQLHLHGTVIHTDGYFIPHNDNTDDLGSITNRYKSLHLGPDSLVIHNDIIDTQKLVLDFSGTEARIRALGSASLSISAENFVSIDGIPFINTLGLGQQYVFGNYIDAFENLPIQVNMNNIASGLATLPFLLGSGWTGLALTNDFPAIISQVQRSPAFIQQGYGFKFGASKETAWSWQVVPNAAGVYASDYVLSYAEADISGGNFNEAARFVGGINSTTRGLQGLGFLSANIDVRSPLHRAVSGTLTLRSEIADSVNNIGLILQQTPALTASGTKVLQLKNGSTTLFDIDHQFGFARFIARDTGILIYGADPTNNPASISFTNTSLQLSVGTGSTRSNILMDVGLGGSLLIQGPEGTSDRASILMIPGPSANTLQLGAGLSQINFGSSGIQTIGHITPFTDDTYDLGSTTLRYRSLHLGPGSLVVHNDTTNTTKLSLGFTAGEARITTTSLTTQFIVDGWTVFSSDTTSGITFIGRNGASNIQMDGTAAQMFLSPDGSQSVEIHTSTGYPRMVLRHIQARSTGGNQGFVDIWAGNDLLSVRLSGGNLGGDGSVNFTDNLGSIDTTISRIASNILTMPNMRAPNGTSYSFTSASSSGLGHSSGTIFINRAGVNGLQIDGADTRLNDPSATAALILAASTLTLSTGTIRGPNGSASAPTYAFSSGSSDDGIYLKADNELGFATSGIQRWFMDSQGQLVGTNSGGNIASIRAGSSGGPVVLVNGDAGYVLFSYGLTLRNGQGAEFDTPIYALASSWRIADPGNGGAISVANNGACALTSGASGETRTLAIPSFEGQDITITHNVNGGGNIVITVASAFNEAGNTTITLTDAGQFVHLRGVLIGGTRTWRMSANDGATLG